MLNVCSFIGRLVVKPELQTTTGGVQFVKSRLAVQRDYPKNNGQLNAQGFKDYDTDFIPFSIWGKQAPFAATLIAGQVVSLTGSMQTSQYTDKNGAKATSYELNVEAYYVLDKKNKETSNSNDNQTYDQQQPSNQNSFGNNQNGFNQQQQPQQMQQSNGFNGNGGGFGGGFAQQTRF